MPRTAKPPESMTKSALLDAIGRNLSKEETIALYKAVNHGFRPYAKGDEAPVFRHKTELEAGLE